MGTFFSEVIRPRQPRFADGELAGKIIAQARLVEALPTLTVRGVLCVGRSAAAAAALLLFGWEIKGS